MRLPVQSFAWFQRLNGRERVLTLLVAGTVFVLLNLLAIRFLLDSYGSLTTEYAQERRDALRLQILADQKAMWSQRNDWLKSTQPVLTNRDRAGTALYEQVQNLARGKQVIVSALQIKPAAITPAGPAARDDGDAPQVVSVETDTQGDWKDTVHFLTEIQKPENFLVFELASLRSNPADAKQMKCHFLISKWYAPARK